MAFISPGFFMVNSVQPAFAVTFDGSAQDAATSATQVYTVAGSIAAGSMVVVFAAQATNAGSLTSITDSKGNTYAIDETHAATSGKCIGTISTSFTSVALAPGDTITATWSSSTVGHGMIVASCNHAQASMKDQVVSANGTSTAATAGPTGSATAQASEVCFGFVVANTSVACTEDAAYTNLANITINSATGRICAGYRVLVATGAQTYSPTLGTSQIFSTGLVTYKLT